MRRLLPIAVLLVALVGAQPAATTVDKTVSVSITHVAFVPNNVTIETGDAITWTNNDTVNHQLVSQKAGIGSPVIKPGDTWSFTFSIAGKFTVSDSLDSKFPKLTVTVKAAPAALSLSVPAAVRYGSAATLNGKLSTGQAGVRINLWSQPCGEGTLKRIASSAVSTAAGGVFAITVHPTTTTVYQVRTSNVTSPSGTVRVRPMVVLSKIRTGKFRVRVYAAQSLVGHSVVFQRFIARQHKWRTVKTVVLRVPTSAVTPLPGTIVSSVSFGIRLKAGYRVRAVMTSAAAAPCYIAGASPTIRS